MQNYIKFIFLFVFFNKLSISFSQYNDTIFYKSGNIKVVDIESFDEKKIDYNYTNSKGVLKNISAAVGGIKRFVIYDNENRLEYDSNADYSELNLTLSKKTADSLAISKHILSVNPIGLALLAASASHQYTFGKKMQFGIISRVTYFGPNIADFNAFTASAGFKFTPIYTSKFSLGVDLSAYTNTTLTIFLPISLNFDIFLNSKWGIRGDFGTGRAIFRLDEFATDIAFRGHIGVFYQFQNKKTLIPLN